tara:strand:+ start:119 stop:520 length:402 start_codon:yes stop_codon:yes gene_type:complete
MIITLFKVKNNKITTIEYDEGDTLVDYDGQDASYFDTKEDAERYVNRISAPSFEVNPDYTHFVVNKLTGKIVSGWECKEDAVDSMNEFEEMIPVPVNTPYLLEHIYKTDRYKVIGIINPFCYNPFDSANWGNK